MITTPRAARAAHPAPRRATSVGLGLLAVLCVGSGWLGAAGCVGSDPGGTTPAPSTTTTSTSTSTSTAPDGAPPPPDGAAPDAAAGPAKWDEAKWDEAKWQ